MLLLTGGALAYAAGLAVQLGQFLPGFVPNLVLATVLLYCGVIAAEEGFVRRAGRSLGIWYTAGIVAAATVGEFWFGIVRPDAVWRVRVEDYFIACVLILAMVRGRLFNGGRREDMVLGASLVPLLCWCLLRTWFAVSTPAVDGGAQFGTGLFVPSVYAMLVLFMVVNGAVFVSQEIAGVVDVLSRERDTDPLTGVLNRRGFDARAQLMIEDSTLAPVTFLLCDLDYLKRVNDRFGHHAGDEVLRRLGQVLRGGVRNIDLVGMLGGEEFAILLARVDGADGLTVAERLREQCRRRDSSFCLPNFESLRALAWPAERSARCWRICTPSRTGGCIGRRPRAAIGHVHETDRD